MTRTSHKIVLYRLQIWNSLPTCGPRFGLRLREAATVLALANCCSKLLTGHTGLRERPGLARRDRWNEIIRDCLFTALLTAGPGENDSKKWAPGAHSVSQRVPQRPRPGWQNGIHPRPAVYHATDHRPGGKRFKRKDPHHRPVVWVATGISPQTCKDDRAPKYPSFRLLY